MADQFEYVSDDLHDFSVAKMPPEVILAVLLRTEIEQPGTLHHLLRETALILDEWTIRSESSDPRSALKVQRELDEWLLQSHESPYPLE